MESRPTNVSRTLAGLWNKLSPRQRGCLLELGGMLGPDTLRALLSAVEDASIPDAGTHELSINIAEMRRARFVWGLNRMESGESDRFRDASPDERGLLVTTSLAVGRWRHLQQMPGASLVSNFDALCSAVDVCTGMCCSIDHPNFNETAIDDPDACAVLDGINAAYVEAATPAMLARVPDIERALCEKRRALDAQLASLSDVCQPFLPFE